MFFINPVKVNWGVSVRVFLFSFLGATLWPSLAIAQNSDEIIVSAQKRAQSDRDVPLAISAFSADNLEALGVEQFDDLADFVPGLEVQEQSANNPGFVIRGITSDSGEATIEPRVSIYQDGVSISRSRGSFVEIFDSQVEVARGPQPTLFGRSALIGAISVTSNAPIMDKTSAHLRASYGNFDQRSLTAIGNLPIVSDKAALRAALLYKKRDGYIDNNLGEALNGYETLAGRVSLSVKPTERLSFSLIGGFQSDDNTGTAFKSGTFFLNDSAPTSPFETAEISSFGGLFDDRDLGLNRDILSLTTSVNYIINENIALTSTTNYREFDSFEVFDPDGFQYELFAFAENAQSEQLSQEIRFNVSLSDNFAGFFGGAYFNEDGFQHTPLGIGENIAQALLGGFLFTERLGVPQTPLPLNLIPNVNVNPNSPLFGLPLGTHLEEATNFGKTESWDLFADMSFAVTDKLELTGGIRYTRDNKTSGFTANSESLSNLTGVGLLLGTGVISQGQLIETKDDFDGLSWRTAARYALDEKTTLFANYARGRRPEVLTYNFDATDQTVFQTGTLPNTFDTLDSEIVNAYEAGFKALLLENSLKLDISSYIYDYSNFQSTIIDVDTGQSRPVNAGNASAFGIEGNAHYAINKNLNIFTNYALTDATFDEADDDGNRQLFAGNRFRLTPKHALTIGSQYTHEFPSGEFIISPVFKWKSRVFFNNDNDQDDPAADELQDAFGLLDLNMKFSPRKQSWEIGFSAKNLTNTRHLLDAGNVGGIFGIPTFIAAPPRTYELSLSYDF